MAHSVPSRKSPATLAVVAVLLIAAVAASFWVPIYARVMPKLGPFPFFYWYLILLVPAVALVSWICYLLLRTRAAADAGSGSGGGAHR